MPSLIECVKDENTREDICKLGTAKEQEKKKLAYQLTISN